MLLSRKHRAAVPVLVIQIFLSAFCPAGHCQADDLNPVALRKAPSHVPVVLVENGEAKANICVMVEQRASALRLATTELQECIELSTGAKLPIIRGQIQPPAIIIGDCEDAERQGLAGGEMPIEGFAIKTAPDRVFIVGHDGPVGQDTQAYSNGSAWGIFEFLERFVGVRWYWPANRGGRSIIKKKNLVVEPVWLQDAPTFRKRQIWPPMAEPWHGKGQPLTPLQTKLRAGNSWPINLRVHTPRWDKVKEYVENRPQCFQRRSDGTRNFTMLCYGYPKTLETYLENIALHFDQGRKANLGIMGDAITVSPNDAAIACYCERCRKLWNEKGGQYGTASKVLAEFVHKLARAVKKRWPDKTIIYLPYLNYTAAPDGYKFPGNVEVQLCGMPGIAQYKEPSINASEQANLEKWVEITGRPLQTWHYSCWPADKTKAPYQYPHVLKAYYQRNRKRLIGTFVNGVKDHWPRQHISLYAWAKLMWDPDFDVDAGIDEYCRRMYGRAADTMRELVRIQTEGWEKSRWPADVLSPKAIYHYSYPREKVEMMKELLKRARDEGAGDEAVLQRLDYYATPFPDFFAEFESVVEGKGARPLVVQKVGENPTVDGKLDEPVWKKAQGASLVKSDGKKEIEPKYPTTLKAVWTPDGVTFGFHMSEPSPNKLVRTVNSRDESQAWWNDCVEIFVDVTGKNEGEWYQFIINPNGAIHDGKNMDTSWNAKGLKARAHIGEDFWSLEVYIPYSTFPDGLKPATGVEWYGQFTRHRMSDYKESPDSLHENQRLNFKFGGPNRNLADFSPVKFVE